MGISHDKSMKSSARRRIFMIIFWRRTKNNFRRAGYLTSRLLSLAATTRISLRKTALRKFAFQIWKFTFIGNQMEGNSESFIIHMLPSTTMEKKGEERQTLMEYLNVI